ncbi:MAG: biotin--[acetyl-CoA-carboxylase] ligase [Alphaproteobacteria bacterium]|nr:biotin--[acetyl-CoA-carboxylase] ligase [Alphaproteobacteria bacterium]
MSSLRFRVERHQALGSTNDLARSRAEAGEPEGLVVQADEQTAGRGRRGRIWQSPVGNLYTSALLRPPVRPAEAAQLSFVAALAVSDAVAAALPPGAPVITCKWPNDVLVGGEKIAGILLESRSKPDGLVDWVIIGTGINVALLPANAGQPATALTIHGATGDIGGVLTLFAEALGRWYQAWRSGGFAPIRTAWTARADGIGRRIRVRLPDREMHGVFAALDESGTLMLRTDDGATVPVAAGDVFRED